MNARLRPENPLQEARALFAIMKTNLGCAIRASSWLSMTAMRTQVVPAQHTEEHSGGFILRIFTPDFEPQ